MYRFTVPGGWLYVYRQGWSGSAAVTPCFVKDPHYVPTLKQRPTYESKQLSHWGCPEEGPDPTG